MPGAPVGYENALARENKCELQEPLGIHRDAGKAWLRDGPLAEHNGDVANNGECASLNLSFHGERDGLGGATQCEFASCICGDHIS